MYFRGLDADLSQTLQSDFMVRLVDGLMVTALACPEATDHSHGFAGVTR